MNSKENYKTINYDPTTTNSETVNKVILRFQNEIFLSSNIFEGLKSKNPKTPHCYLKPRIHEVANPETHVVSSINTHTSRISNYFDYYLQPIVKEIPSYVEDTTGFLMKIREIDFVLGISYLVSLDVISLYTNIPNMEGI